MVMPFLCKDSNYWLIATNDSKGPCRSSARAWNISPYCHCPTLGGSIILFIKQTSSSSATFWNCFETIIQNGELFIYSASTLAPVIYIVTRDRDNVRSFPSKQSFIGLVVFCTLLASIIFTLERIESQNYQIS